jgi:hypothetical protein
MHAITSPATPATRSITEPRMLSKAHMFIHRAELKAAIDAAHKHGFKVTGHLCSVTYLTRMAAISAPAV